MGGAKKERNTRYQNLGHSGGVVWHINSSNNANETNGVESSKSSTRVPEAWPNYPLRRSTDAVKTTGIVEARRERGRRGGERGHWNRQPFQVTIKMALLLPSVFLSAFLSTQHASLYSSLSSMTHVRSFCTQTTLLLTAVHHGSSQSTAAYSTRRCKLVSPLYLHEKPALSSRILQCTVRAD